MFAGYMVINWPNW